jgi:hypothetical protein
VGIGKRPPAQTVKLFSLQEPVEREGWCEVQRVNVSVPRKWTSKRVDGLIDNIG